MMVDLMAMFKAVILVQLFYAFAITGLSYAMPADSLDYVTSVSDITGTVDLQSVSEDVEASLTRQTDIPLIEIGALVFYSGNIVIDLLLNFAFAIPQMIGYLIWGVTSLIQLDADLVGITQIFFSVAVVVMYVIGLMQLLTGIRSGRVI